MEQVLQPASLGDRNPLSEVLLAAAAEAGLPHNPSFDSGTLDGVGWNRSTIRNGRRNNSFQAFVAPVADRPNLTVLSGTLVHRLLVDNGGTVSGVETLAGRRRGDDADRGRGSDVVRAGAFDSPRLLMLSGIGPAEHLRSLGIDVDSRPARRREPDRPPADRRRLRLEAARSRSSTRWSPRLRLRLVVVPARHRTRRGDLLREGDELRAADRRRPPPYTIIPGITQPRSRGTVTLRSADPTDPPVIDPNYLCDPEDLRMLIDGIHLSREIGAPTRSPTGTTASSSPGRGGVGRGDRGLHR